MTEREMPDNESTKLMQPVTLAMREAVLHLDTHDFGKTRERNREKIGERKTFNNKKERDQGDDTAVGKTKKRKEQSDVGEKQKVKKTKTDNVVKAKLKSDKPSSLGQTKKKKKKKTQV